jgi:ABC-type glutathione transport system ATPase component
MSNTAPLLQVRNLASNFPPAAARCVALDDVSFDIAAARCSASLVNPVPASR